MKIRAGLVLLALLLCGSVSARQYPPSGVGMTPLCVHPGLTLATQTTGANEVLLTCVLPGGTISKDGPYIGFVVEGFFETAANTNAKTYASYLDANFLFSRGTSTSATPGVGRTTCVFSDTGKMACFLLQATTANTGVAPVSYSVDWTASHNITANATTAVAAGDVTLKFFSVYLITN